MIFAAIPESALIERVHSHPGLQARAPPRARPGGHSPVRNCDSRRIPKSEAVLRPFVRHPRLRRGGTAAGRAGPRPEAFDGRLAHRTRRAGRLRPGWPCGLRGGGAVARALCRAAELQLPQHPRHRPRDDTRHAAQRASPVVPARLPQRVRTPRLGRGPARHCRVLSRQWSSTWPLDEASFERSAAAFDNTDFVDVVIHSYRHRFGLVDEDLAIADIEAALALQPPITVPTFSFDGGDDGVRAPAIDEAAQHAGQELVLGELEACVLHRHQGLAENLALLHVGQSLVDRTLQRSHAAHRDAAGRRRWSCPRSRGHHGAARASVRRAAGIRARQNAWRCRSAAASRR